jgi:arylsulfatase A-like enzyme
MQAINSSSGRNVGGILLVLLGLLFTPLLFAQDRKPNIVLILMDNVGYGELGTYGGGVRRGAPTPRIDSLATDGLKLTNFNTEVICTPSRSALMTGRFAIRSGTLSLAEGPNGGLVQWEVTLPEMLHPLGYDSALFGKWHLGDSPGRYPTDQGFDEWYGILRSNDESLWPGTPGYDPNKVPPEQVMEGRKGGKSTDVALFDREMRSRFDGEITQRAVGFIKREARSGKPFFAYLAMTTGHIPTIPSPPWRGRTGNGPWADCLAQLDFYIGSVLDAIKEAGIEKNTIVVFTADNGADWLPGNRGWAGPWRGSYGTAMEGGLRVPFLIKWPGKIPAGRESDEIVHLVDIFPTFAAFVGGQAPADRVIDGVDDSKFFRGQEEHSGRDFFPIFGGDGTLLGMKWKHWKFDLFDQVNGDDARVPHPRLINLLIDPLEEGHTVAYENTWVLAEAGREMQKFQESLQKFPPIPAGTPDPYVPPKP